MKFFIVLFTFTLSLSVFSQTTVKQVTESARSIKAEMRSSLKDLKYDGSKITYYEVKDFPVFKEFEITLFLRGNYVLYFSGEAANNNVGMRIYDKAYDEVGRTLLYEIKDISSKKIEVATADLNEVYKKSTGRSDNLKSVYVEYSIPKGTPDLGGIVLIFGY
jgi:hypothetical protein